MRLLKGVVKKKGAFICGFTVLIYVGSSTEYFRFVMSEVGEFQPRSLYLSHILCVRLWTTLHILLFDNLILLSRIVYYMESNQQGIGLSVENKTKVFFFRFFLHLFIEKSLYEVMRSGSISFIAIIHLNYFYTTKTLQNFKRLKKPFLSILDEPLE